VTEPTIVSFTLYVVRQYDCRNKVVYTTLCVNDSRVVYMASVTNLVCIGSLYYVFV